MKHEEVIKWLSRHKENIQKLSILQDHIATIRSRVGNATGSGLNLNDAGKCTTHRAVDPISELSLSLQDYEKEYQVILRESSKIEREITLAIHSLPNMAYLEKELLTNKYLYFYPNEKNYKELNILKKTFEYHLELGLSYLQDKLIKENIIIPLEITSPERELLKRIIN